MIKRLAIALVLLAAPMTAFAQTVLEDPLSSGGDLRIVIGRVIRAALGLSGAIALCMFVYGGFQWLTSGGSPEKVKSGKSTLTWAVIGLVVIFTAYTLVATLITALTQGTT